MVVGCRLQGRPKEESSVDPSWFSQARRGLVELSVLAALRAREAYGYELLQRLAEVAGLGITESTLYPILARHADDGLLTVRQVPSPSGPPRRYYRLTAAGAKQLDAMVLHWRALGAGLDALWTEGPAATKESGTGEHPVAAPRARTDRSASRRARRRAPG
jgi:PadR family transcriptional regulator PadR